MLAFKALNTFMTFYTLSKTNFECDVLNNIYKEMKLTIITFPVKVHAIFRGLKVFQGDIFNVLLQEVLGRILNKMCSL